MMTVRDLPALNACMNFIAAILLFLGRRAIKKGARRRHRTLMLGALCASAIFLGSYLYYHFTERLVTRYSGGGPLRYAYYAILATHVPLAVLMVPFIFYALQQAFLGNFERHTKVTRRLWPVWMYVSVTGVLIYLMLYQNAWNVPATHPE